MFFPVLSASHLFPYRPWMAAAYKESHPEQMSSSHICLLARVRCFRSFSLWLRSAHLHPLYDVLLSLKNVLKADAFDQVVHADSHVHHVPRIHKLHRRVAAPLNWTSIGCYTSVISWCRQSTSAYFDAARVLQEERCRPRPSPTLPA